MSDIVERLREELRDEEYAEGYAESFLDSYIATQIKVLREQRGLSQQALAERLGTRQNAISRIEDVDYSKWNVMTLKKLARAFHVRLRVSFETYGTLLADVAAFSRESLQRVPREEDDLLKTPVAKPSRRIQRRRKQRIGSFHQASYSAAQSSMEPVGNRVVGIASQVLATQSSHLAAEALAWRN